MKSALRGEAKNKSQSQNHLRGEVSPSLRPAAVRPFSATPSTGAGRPRNAPPKVKIKTSTSKI